MSHCKQVVYQIALKWLFGDTIMDLHIIRDPYPIITKELSEEKGGLVPKRLHPFSWKG